MAEIDAELVERVARWCAEAGRQAGGGEIRAALAALSWDELLAARALLADPPPAKPLGPQALADLARGTPADIAAEREREGRYAPAPDAPDAAAEDEAPAPTRRRVRAKGASRPATVVIHRARDRVAAPEAEPPPPPPPPFEALRAPAGRAVIERFLRRHGARRAALVAELAAGWRLPGGAAPGDAELRALLEHHGLARAFERRERDELLHALRAAGGSIAAAAARVGLDAAGLDAALARLGASGDAESIREDRRAELRARATTLAERVRLMLGEEERLRDLGLLEELEADLRARLPEHVRALRAAGGPLAPSLAQSLGVELDAAGALARRLGVELGPASSIERRHGAAAPRPRGGERTRGAPPRRGGREGAAPASRKPSPGDRRAGQERPRGPRTPGGGGPRTPGGGGPRTPGRGGPRTPGRGGPRTPGPGGPRTPGPGVPPRSGARPPRRGPKR